MPEKTYEEICQMTPEELKEYYDQRAKETNNQPRQKMHKKTKKNLKRKERQKKNKAIREQKYDKPFDWNPQFQPKIANAVKRRRNQILRGAAPQNITVQE